MTKEEKARFDEAVQEEVTRILSAQQQQFATMIEQTMKSSVEGVRKVNEDLEKERERLQKEQDAAREEQQKAAREGEQLAQQYFEGRQKQFREAAQTELLRDLTRKHLEAGKSVMEIADWLALPLDFVEEIALLLDRVSAHRDQTKHRQLISGNPKLHYSDSGRGGTIRFESNERSFEMWWEFAGGDALVILDIPTKEQWTKLTGLPREKRKEVLTFIGEQIVVDNISGTGSFIIGENVITFYRG